MALSVAELHPVLHDLFNDTADELARSAGFCERKRKLSGSAFAKAAVFCLLEKAAPSLQDFADFASENLGVDASHNAFDQRFGSAAAADFLASLFATAFSRCLS